jgi:hypothetical protein
VLSQLWGLFAGPEKDPPPPSVGGTYVNRTGTPLQIVTIVQTYRDGVPYEEAGRAHTIPAGATYTRPEDAYAVLFDSPGPYPEDRDVAEVIYITGPDGVVTERYAAQTNGFPYKTTRSGTWPAAENVVVESLWRVRVWDGNGYNIVPTPEPEADAPPALDVPFGRPGQSVLPFPWVTPEELAALRPVPLPLPGAEDLPDPLNPQPATTPQQLPAIGQPVAPPLLRPAPAGTTVQPVTPYLPAVAPAVATTPADVHYPAPGVPITSNPPAATLQGIAQEVGRIENKVNRLLNPEAGTGLDKLELIRGTLFTLLDFLSSITSGGSYDLEAPCETAEDGGPLVVEHPYSGAVNSVVLLHNKVDALAALVQTHKNMRQPICKPAPPTGQPVTVQFEEV